MHSKGNDRQIQKIQALAGTISQIRRTAQKFITGENEMMFSTPVCGASVMTGLELPLKNLLNLLTV